MALTITGHPRSGTAILMHLCNDHPQITLTKEFGNFAFLGIPFPDYCYKILGRWNTVRNRWAFDMTESHRRSPAVIGNSKFMLRFLLGVGRHREKQISPQAVEASLRKIYPEAFIVGDKCPTYSLQLDKLAHLDGLKTLVIYRDCRDVTSSFLLKARTAWRRRKWIAKQNTAEKIAARWVRMINEMENCADDIQIIRYEDLVYEPQKAMKSVGHWLNVDPQLFPIDRVKRTSIGKYTNGLSSSELLAVMSIAGPTMARLGYI